MERPVGTIFVELDLDASRYLKGQQRLLKDATSVSLNIEENFKKLGIKSSAEMDLMRQKITNSFDMISHSAKATANDILRAEKAKNDQLKRLNEQQFGHQTTLLESIRKNWIAYSAAIYAVGYAMTTVFKKGFEAVEEYNKSIASLAAMVVTFSERQKGVSLSEQWKEALKYSTAMVPVLENLAARTLLSGEETTALANAFARAGVFLDASNAKQIESFTRISNALPLMTQGQEIMRQINTEIRAVMTGSNSASSMMLQTLKAIDPQIEKNLKTWREQGTVLEHIGDLLEGFGPATELLEDQWQAVKSTLETTATQILRDIMRPAYESIIDAAKDLNAWLIKNKEAIVDWVTTFRLGVISVQAEIMRMAMLLDKVGGTMTTIQMLLTGPGAALGIESSTKRFEAAAKANIEYEERYNKTSKALEELALKYNKLEASLTAAGKAAAKTTEATVSKFMPKKTTEIDEAAAKAAAKRREQMLAEDVKAAERKYKLWQDSAKAWEDYNDAIFAATATQYEKDMKISDDWLKKQNQRLIDAISGYEEYQTKLTAAQAAAEDMRGIAYHEEQMRQIDDATKQVGPALDNFNKMYAEMGKSRFDLEREQLEAERASWLAHNANKEEVAALYSKRLIDIARAEQAAKLTIYENMAGQIAGTFMQIAQAGGKQSEKAFKLYQAFAIAQALISGYMAFVKTLAEPLLPFPSNVVMAYTIAGMTAVQVAMIAAAKPPSYDQGGISRAAGIYQTGNIDEAHIPLQSGKVPVKLSGEKQGTTIIIHMENPTFQDVATQRQVFAQIAEVIARRVAPDAVVENYQNDGRIRNMVRSRT